MESYPFSFTVNANAKSVRKIANNVTKSGYTIAAILINHTSTNVLQCITSAVLFSGAELHLQYWNLANAQYTLSGTIKILYVKS